MTPFNKLLLIIVLSIFSLSVTANEKKLGNYYGAKDAEHPEWFKESFLDLAEDVADAADENKRLVVYFWQPGCPYCSQLWEDNFSQQNILEKFRKNFEIVSLNMWGDREVVSISGNDYTEKSFAEALGIKYTPTLLFFDENRKVVHQLNGYVPPESFENSLNYVSQKMEKKYNFGEFSSQQLAGKNPSGKLNTQDFFLAANDLSNMKLDDNQHLVVFFESGDCKNCDLLHNKTLKDKTTIDLVKKFKAVQLNRFSDNEIVTPQGEKTSSKNWANTLGISYLPALLFFDKSGKEVMRVDTQMRTFHVQSVFDFVNTASYKTEKNFQRWISARAEHIREEGKDVDIFAY